MATETLAVVEADGATAPVERKKGPNLLLLGSLGIAFTAGLWILLWPGSKRNPQRSVDSRLEEDL